MTLHRSAAWSPWRWPSWPRRVPARNRRPHRPPKLSSGTDAADAPLPAAASPYDSLPEELRGAVLKPFTGDLDEMIKRRVIRVAVTFNRTHYFIDKGQQRGLAYESIKQFEDDLNADLKTGNLKVHVAAVPLSRDQLASALLTGKVDLIAAMLTVTPERRALAAFSRADADQRERSRGHRSWCAADRDAGRPGRPGGVRPRSRASMPRASPD